ncbi:unnamed protein product [Arabidopsis lyrata]|uniref:Uncharacterized protein n=1 Tax=Arabidopsis lyrata subsp. lyrata TaxID=81972 RepID=D7L0P9_ARALL|nr:hypothetical protein ARALYDRAFT_897539 [Arabidopsis lyrata subsp. lyrata]CAH8260298.1 unnamed protein product [Arabidopsis lyrata]
MEVKLWNDKHEREMYENFVELYANIKATEKLDKTLSATIKDIVPNIERFAEAYRWIATVEHRGTTITMASTSSSKLKFCWTT